MKEIKFCPKCGNMVSEDDIVCSKCGHLLNEEKLFEDENESPKQPIYNSNEVPVVEKSTYTCLNYSQALRRNLFISRQPLYVGLIFIAIILAEIFIPYFITGTLGTISILGFVLIAFNLAFLFNYLIISPLRSISMYKKSEIDLYHVSFFKDKIHYQLTMNYKGQPIRNDFFLLYNNLLRIKEYKDMTILGFIIQGQFVPFCLVKDENYDKIIALMKNKIDQIKRK